MLKFISKTFDLKARGVVKKSLYPVKHNPLKPCGNVNLHTVFDKFKELRYSLSWNNTTL